VGREQRNRWKANMKCMEIVKKNPEEITDEDIQYLKDFFTSKGGLVPKGYHGGAFFTPTHLAKFMVEILNIPEDSKILEPSCGSGVFFDYLPKNAEITGIEIDPISAKIASLIYPHVEVIQGNAFDHIKCDYYDFVIGNPPFGETIEVNEDINFETLKYNNKSKTYKGKSEFAFVELAIKSLKPGGYMALILPLNLNNRQAKKVRDLIYNTCWGIANIQLPPETFKHVGTTVPTQILILRKATPNVKKIKSEKLDAEFFEGQQPMFMAVVQDIGWDIRGRSTDIWGDGLTQLDVLAEVFKDKYLIRENLYPHEPSWTGLDVTYFLFLRQYTPGWYDSRRCYTKENKDKELLYWNEMTLGMGEERSWDFYYQDELVQEYYNSL
jgi:hypothetical protein